MHDQLTFHIVDRPHSPGHTLPWVERDDGTRREATPEEVQLWEALQQAKAQHQQQHGKGRK